MMLADLRSPAPAGLPNLLELIRRRFGRALLGVVLYGSCRRRAELDEGLVDLLVIVSGYRQALGTGAGALMNRLLPPNVYYLEADSEAGRLRSKYAVVSLDQFKRRCRTPVDLYFWARFSQPCRLVLSVSDDLAEQLASARAEAASRFAARITPLLQQPGSALDFWSFALATTYRCELRPEPPEAARRLVESDPDYWQRLTEVLTGVGIPILTQPGLQAESSPVSDGPGRLASRAAWSGRRVTGKLYNLARLFKAAGTFTNGIDYIAWKVERHSGVRVEISESMRRHPRLAAWGLAWRLWRKKGFR